MSGQQAERIRVNERDCAFYGEEFFV